ncbi:MAG: hypothetical protein KAH57_05555, partial [Thermoplasmata archaeon]|nr:hypothetical protein [Thermoplasmata archaeon]
MKKHIKYSILISILLLTLLINTILYYDPLVASTSVSLVEQVPILFWVLIMALSILVTYISIYSKSRGVNVLMATIYFFIFYSFNLFFKIIPTQTDIGDTSFFIPYLDNATHLDIGIYRYFEYPFFFLYSSVIKNVLGLDIYQNINYGFFSLILMIPIIMPLLIQKEIIKGAKVVYFLAPVLYLILVFFFFNDQFVPQFYGLIFLMITIGC